jgi:flagellar hook protein FlgE
MTGLPSIFSTALSGMNAASAQLALTAHNIANLNTPHFKAARANLASTPAGGVRVASITTDNSPAPFDETNTESSNTNLATELVHLKLSKLLYTANGVVFRTASNLTGTLLNVLH